MFNIPINLLQTNKEERVPAKLRAQHWETQALQFLCLLQNSSRRFPFRFLLKQLGLKEACGG